MKSQPLVSVVIPLYNNERYVEAALASIFMQDYPNMEVIVVNDGSTDNSVSRLHAYLHKITVLHQENKGSASARNTGIEYTKGKYVAFLDADDIWLPGKITAQVEFLESNPTFGGVHSNRVKWIVSELGPLDLSFNFNTLPMDISDDFSGWILRDVLKDKCSDTITFMFRRQCLIDVGMYNTKLPVGVDFDICLRLSSHFKIHKLNGIYAVYRVNTESVSHRYEHLLILHTIVNDLLTNITPRSLANNNITYQTIKQRLSVDHSNVAVYHLWKNELMLAIKHLYLAFKYDPSNKAAYMFLYKHLWKLVPKMVQRTVS